MGFTDQMANREVCDLIFEDYKTGKPFLFMDYANTNTTELTGETVFAYGGKGHPKKVGFTGERAGTMTIETQMQTAKLWAMTTGGNVNTTCKYVKRVETTVSASKKITLTEDKTIDEGSVAVYEATDINLDKELKCSVVGKEITLTDEKALGTKVVVFYGVTRDDAYTVNIKSTSFPKAFKVYGDTYMKTESEDILPYRITAYKAQPQANLSLSFANNGDPGSITITLDLLEDKDHNMLDLSLLPEEE